MNSKGPINNFVCKNLRQIRIGKGIKVLEVAERTGIPASSYSCLEWGRYKLNLDNLFRILQAVGADITDVWPMADKRPVEAVTREHVEEVLRQSEKLRPPDLSVEEFVEAVCQVCGVERIDREASRNSREIREIQVMAAIIVRDVPQITLTSLSRALGVNISSLSHRTRRMMDRFREDGELRQRVEDARRQVLDRLPGKELAQAS